VSADPVFVVGLGGTGKTPLARLLNERTSILVSRHTQLWRRFGGRFGVLVGEAGLERCLDELCTDAAVAALEPDRDQLRAALYPRVPVHEGEVFTLIHRQHALRRGARRWGEQCGGGSRGAPLLAAVPTARIVHLVQTDADGDGAASSPPGPRHLARAARAATLRHADLRRGRISGRRSPGRYLVVASEDLRTRPESTVRAVCRFLEEPLGSAPVELEWRSSRDPAGGRSHAIGPTGSGRPSTREV
jgi:hypothetical protein